MIRKTGKIIIGLLGLFCFKSLQAQNISDQVKPVDSTFLHINGEGIFINLGKNKDSRINISATIQPGFQYSSMDSADEKINSNRFSLNLLRIGLNGIVFKERVLFGFVTDLTGTIPILEGWIGFNFWNKAAKFTIGQRQTNTNNRLAMEDERYAQNMGQSISGKSTDGTVSGGLMQNFVGATREGGVFFETNFTIQKWRIYPSVSITTGEGQNFFSSQPNLGFKYGGRIDVMPFGDFIKNNAFIAHDLYYESSPKLAIGFAGSNNEKASSPNGSENGIITGIYKDGVQDYANYRKLIADFIFKYQGFSFIGEYINATVAGTDLFLNAGGTTKLTPETASSMYNIGNGMNLQSSYVFKNKWVVDGRYSRIIPEFNIATSLVHNQNWYTVGINKYFKGNAVKIGLNTSFIDDNNSSVTVKKWISNLAVQIIL